MSTAPFLAPERDGALKVGRAKAGGGTVYFSVPGVSHVSAGGDVMTANTDYYSPMWIVSPLVIDQLITEVTSAAAGGSVLRIGLYAADTNWQPLGAPLADSGSLAADSTGIKTYTPGTPLHLPRGRYVSVINTNGAPTVGFITGVVPGGSLYTSTGTAKSLGSLSVSRTHAAFPTPGTAWTTIANTTGSFHNYVFVRVSTP